MANQRQKRKSGGRWIRYVVTELIFLLVGALFLTFLARRESKQTKKNETALFTNLNETLEETNESSTAARALIRTVQSLYKEDGYEGNVALLMEFQTSIAGESARFECGQNIDIVFYENDGAKFAWKLSAFFPEEQLKAFRKFANEHPEWTVTVQEVYTRVTVSGIDAGFISARSSKTIDFLAPTQITFRSGPTKLTLTSGLEGELTYRAGEDESGDGESEYLLDNVDFYMLSQSEDTRFVEDAFLKQDCIVYSKFGPRKTNLMMPRGEEVISVSFGSDVPIIAYTVYFNRDAIVRARVLRPALLLALFLQAAVVYLMIIMWGVDRRRREAKELRDTFINAMAHQLKTPVAVVQNTAEYLATGNSPEKREHYCDVLVHEGENMNYLLNRMLTYTRVMDRGATLNLQEVPLDSLVDEVLASHQEIIPERGITIDFSERSGSNVKCDPDLIKMVIDNMIGNAVRYGEEGSTVLVRTEGAEFSVYNRGEHLSDEEQGNIWTPMYAAKKQELRGETGGMGLAISAAILDRHGADYRVSNEEGGVRFRFDLAMTGKKRMEEKAIWVNILTVSLDILLAFMNAWMFLTRVKWIYFFITFLWLFSGGCFLISFFSYSLFRRRNRKTA
ncbi:MAG: HAMP domain-containing histidine kinase [Lachnospiraceae bacterium]|nr:HAMP domain-containing histidine kinase [Lachnospiraceae bacterium]